MKCLLLLPMVSLLLSACATADRSASSDSPTPSDLAPVSTNLAEVASPSHDTLRVGDEVTIEFRGVPNPPEKHEERIKEDGTIKPPIIDRDPEGPVHAAGVTRLQLEQELQKRYARYYKGLTVTVHTENRVFYVNGEVRAPSRYPYTGEMSVLKAVTTAGGFTDFAKKSKVQLIRPNGKKTTIDCAAALRNPKLDLPVLPDDVIYVPRRYF